MGVVSLVVVDHWVQNRCGIGKNLNTTKIFS